MNTLIESKAVANTAFAGELSSRTIVRKGLNPNVPAGL